MNTSARALTVSLTSIVALTLAGCSGGSDVESPASTSPSAAPAVSTPASTPSPSETAAEPETSPSPEAVAAAPGDVTAPGATLAFGDTALVPWDTYSSDTPIHLNVTVKEPRKGDLSDFDGLGLKDDTLAQIKGFTPYYVDFDITKANLDEGEIAFNAAYTEIGAVNADGGKIPDFTIIGSYEKCDTESFGKDADTGAVTTSCSVFLVPSGQEFGGATWDQYDTAYDDYEGKPVLWTK